MFKRFVQNKPLGVTRFNTFRSFCLKIITSSKLNTGYLENGAFFCYCAYVMRISGLVCVFQKS